LAERPGGKVRMNSFYKYTGHTLVNTALLGVLVLIMTVPIGFSLFFLSSSQPAFKAAFKVTPSQINYGEYLTLGEVAGGQAEEITITYTAFPNFEAYYEGICVVENIQARNQTFSIRKPEGRDVRLFFGTVGATSGPTEIILKSGEKGLINLVAGPVMGNQPTVSTLTFTLESFPTPQ
jgi:hypothetical protein